MTRVIDEHDVTVLLGDVREQLATLPDRSVNCIVTSPPYYGLRDYGVDGQIGLEASPAKYIAEMVTVFHEARRVLADDGVLWLNLGDSYVANSDGYLRGKDVQRQNQPSRRTREASGRLPDKNLRGMPWRVALAMQDDGWRLRNDVIWSKPNGMPQSVTDRLASRHEHVFLFAKSRFYWFDLAPLRLIYTGDRAASRRARTGAVNKSNSLSTPWSEGGEGRLPDDVWEIATQPLPGAHFATMPPELARRCILAGCPADGMVLDPFAGSGTTLKVARSLGRKSIGIELNPSYIEIIRDRIGDTPFDFGEAS